ncbi:M16 family metallopeptidase [Algivirga pacifica]|uniref:Insulinase family protein n=1 Tax=Algivirga pacifica TaxID=1162670 RepID=A0ABP9DGL5_9BACT
MKLLSLRLKNTFLGALALPILLTACNVSTPFQLSENYKYDYQQVEGDPLKAKIYTLKNGLKVYMSVYKDAPRIQTYIAVKAGGKYDPVEATGLAHYLEHMMFKGTDEFGTMNYAEEKVLLDSIERMFEHYRTLEDPKERKEYYTLIDEVSNQASKLAIANEYDKMVSGIGATGTNAYTTTDRTVYINDIPSTSLEKWLKIEGERFSMIVNRLFHTELEAVYEEKNRSLDADGWKVYAATLETMFPTHKYGQQTVIGTIDHLKNPSITEIRKYFDQYYRPNNVAICLSGDLDPDQTIDLIEKYFGNWEAKPLEEYTYQEEAPIKEVVEREVFGPDAANVTVNFRFPGEASNSRDFLKMKLCDMILSNSKAGLIDLNLKQKQEVVSAGCYPMIMNDYTVHSFYATPKEGQTLEEARDLLLGQIELLKQGAFEDWLIDAVINDFKKSQIQQFESNSARASMFVSAFTNDIPWKDYVNDLEEMRTITKEELVAFANAQYAKNYSVIYKRVGEDPNARKIEKPEITKVDLNRGVTSTFSQVLDTLQSKKLEPVFLAYDKVIQEEKMNKGVLVRYKQNEENDLFKLYYLLDVGSNTNPTLSMAVEYLKFLGTDKMSSEQIQKEFYKLGCDFGVNVSSDQVYVYLQGLDENMEPALTLFEELLANAQPDKEALSLMVANKLKMREDLKKNKRAILMQGLRNYGLYGADSPLRNDLSNQELQEVAANSLVQMIQGLTKMEHRVLYYGPRASSKAIAVLNELHTLPETLTAIPEEKKFEMKDAVEPKVYWTDYDMVQAEILFLAKSDKYTPKREAVARLYNEYFGGGMGSIVFQEMREAQGLAYSVYSMYAQGSKEGKSDYVFAYVGTQADKLEESLKGMKKLLTDMPLDEKSFENAKKSMLSKMESKRITKASVLFDYERTLKKGLNHDIRKDVYEAIQNMTLEDVKTFQEEFVKGQNYTLCVVGDKEKLDFEVLSQYGKVQELSLEDLFGFESPERVEKEL